MRKQIENIEAELDADKVTAEKKALLEKGNIMEENYREKHQNYTTNSEVLSDLKAKIITEKEAFTLKKKAIRIQLYTTFPSTFLFRKTTF